tara:strand:+ start:1470 stop:2540 length:1071 start_codon:yes stop_codon:yes gene_type:complete
MKILRKYVIALAIATGAAMPTFGDEMMRADSHAPIGVMGDHRHGRGEWMFSYRFMHMDMADNRITDEEINPDTIATTIPNRFFGSPMQPPTLRIVPLTMTMHMHMFSLMYAPTDWITLMAMLNYTEKEMDHVTYLGAAGTTRLGEFTTETSGIGDTRVSGLVRLFDWKNHDAHFNIGISLPSGSSDEKDRILTPTGGTPTVRLPYAMQLGSGTVDFLPGLTYTGKSNKVAWGTQYAGTIRLEKNNGYQWGNKHLVTGWLSYSPSHWISGSIRIEFDTMGVIDGRDPQIVGPVQTADPDNYGGDKVNLKLGINFMAFSGLLRGQRFMIEGGVPLKQDLHGPQMETDFTLTTGWQIAF